MKLGDPLGLLLLGFGVVFGGWHWIDSAGAGKATTAGTVMLSAMPVPLLVRLRPRLPLPESESQCRPGGSWPC